MGHILVTTACSISSAVQVESSVEAGIGSSGLGVSFSRLGGIGYGLRMGSPALLWLGYAGFSIEVLGLYFKTVGTLLGSSLFFLSAGIIVTALAAIAYRLHARTSQEVTP